MPQTMRSGLVGINLRWRLRRLPSGPITTTVLNSVVPLKRLSISLMPSTIGHVVLCSRILNRLQIAARNIDGIAPKARMDFARQRHIAARPQPPDPGRVTGNIGFGKHEQRSAGSGSLIDCGQNAFYRLVPIEQDGRFLNHGNFHGHDFDPPVAGSMVRRISMMRSAAKPASSACLRTMSGSVAK